MALKTYPYNPTRGIKTDEDVVLYLQTFLEENGIQGLQSAIRNIAESDIPGSGLAVKLKAQGEVTADNFESILDSLGLKLSVQMAA